MNTYEDYDYAAIEEAEAILNGTIPSTPETYKLVEQWYGNNENLKPRGKQTIPVVLRNRTGIGQRGVVFS